LNERKEHDEERHAYLFKEVSRRQRNTLWPDAMVNSSSVDALLWKGSPKATKVQRVGIVVWGLTLMCRQHTYCRNYHY
jgi:hypothetical protein